uniref:Uncharacterized protein n=2 Tax=Caenorhabditis japonica TaxID=281687 RepID=A0A8R1DGT5_CAEJA
MEKTAEERPGLKKLAPMEVSNDRGALESRAGMENMPLPRPARYRIWEEEGGNEERRLPRNAHGNQGSKPQGFDEIEERGRLPRNTHGNQDRPKLFEDFESEDRPRIRLFREAPPPDTFFTGDREQPRFDRAAEESDEMKDVPRFE